MNDRHGRQKQFNQDFTEALKTAGVSDSPGLPGYVPPVFELVQLHECHGYAEVVVRAKNGKRVYAGNITLAGNPNEYYST